MNPCSMLRDTRRFFRLPLHLASKTHGRRNSPQPLALQPLPRLRTTWAGITAMDLFPTSAIFHGRSGRVSARQFRLLRLRLARAQGRAAAGLPGGVEGEAAEAGAS